MNEIIPATIPQNLNIIRDRLSKVVGLVRKVQVDIIDGQYTDIKTWPFVDTNSNDLVRFSRGEERFPYIDDFDLEIDMMVLHPIEYLPDFIALGVKSFVIHIDSTDHIKECLNTIKEAGRQAGLGIKPSIDADLLESFLPLTDFVQFMGNDKIGHSGVGLDWSVLEKIKYFKSKHAATKVQVDIGVSEETIPVLKEVGVTCFVSGSAIFTVPDPTEALKKLQNL